MSNTMPTVLERNKHALGYPLFPQPGYEIILNTGGMSERIPTGQYLAGNTGNPGGHPGLLAEVRAKLSELTLPAIEVLLTLCTVTMHGSPYPALAPLQSNCSIT
jgi:hypothetical protein